MTRLFHSSAFYLVLLDLVVSIALYFGAKYLGADEFADVQFLVAALQPIFITIIGKIGYEDAAKAKAEATVSVALIESDSSAPAEVDVTHVETIGEG